MRFLWLFQGVVWLSGVNHQQVLGCRCGLCVGGRGCSCEDATAAVGWTAAVAIVAAFILQAAGAARVTERVRSKLVLDAAAAASGATPGPGLAPEGP